MTDLKHNTPSSSSSSLDDSILQQGKNLITWLVKTFSQIKLYSLKHPTSEQFIETLYQKFENYFAQTPTLELEVTETAFYLDGNKIYEETQLIRSLPFLFYKDGITKLIFYEGLTREEIKQFFQLILGISQLPPEETDIVVALWEMNFSHIDYLAPDEFLESKIGQETDIAPYELDPSSLEEGQIQLTPEDRADFLRYVNQRKKSRDDQPPISPLLEGKIPLPSPRHFELQKEEEERLNLLIQKHRELSEEEETIHLLVETIYLEEKIQPFSQVLKSFSSLIEDTLKQGKLTIADHALDHLLHLKDEFSKAQPEKLLHIDETINLLREKTFSLLQEGLDKKKPSDPESLFSLFEFIGPPSLNLIGHLIDTYPDQRFEELACTYIKKIGPQNIPLLLEIADDKRDKITLVILQTIAQSDAPRRLSYLARFLRSGNQRLQMEAINIISTIDDPKSAKVLLPFLDEQQVEIRKETAKALLRLNQPLIAEDILAKVKDKTFFDRSLTEKKALLGYLFHLSDDRARDFLKSLLKKPWWWSPSSRLKPGLWLIETLKDENKEEVKNFLDSVGFVRNKKIRQALQILKKRLESESIAGSHSELQRKKDITN